MEAVKGRLKQYAYLLVDVDNTTDGLIELDQDLACPDMIAVMHIKLADNAASRMLNLFDI